MIAWVEGLRDLPGNPAGVTVERIGGAVALACSTLPELDFVNTVHGLDPASRGRSTSVTAFYRGLGLRGLTEVAPAPGADALMERLTSAGWAQTGFWCSFHGAPGALPVPAGVEVAEASRGRHAGVRPDPPGRPRGARRRPEGRPRRPCSGWYGRPGWHMYLARVDGVAAASAALTVDAGLGYLANAATLPGHAPARLPGGAPGAADRRCRGGGVRHGRVAGGVRLGQPAQPRAGRAPGGVHTGRVADALATATAGAAGARWPKSYPSRSSSATTVSRAL